MDVRKIPVERINPAKYNPRKDLKPGDAEYDKLRRSIEDFGYVEPVIWNARTGNIVGGHQRFKVLTAMGHTEIDCVVLDIDETREKALNIALNKIGGEFDIPLLTDLLQDIGGSGFDVSLTGFDAVEIDALFGAKSEEKQVAEDGFDAKKAADTIVTPVSQQGDVWLLGNHRLRCGDSTAQADMDALLNGKKARLVVTDAPYNVAYGSTNHPNWKKRSILNDSMTAEQFQAFINKAFTRAFEASEKGAALFAFMSAQEWGRFMPTLENIGWHWSSTIIWVKDTMVMGRKDWQPRYEGIFYGWRGDGPRLYPLKAIRNETDVWEFDRPKKSPLHPTQKPLDVIGKAIRFCSREGDIVLDLFGGSASTLIAADQLGRCAYLQELDKKFVDVGVKRYVRHKGGGGDVFLLRDDQLVPFAETGMEALF